MYKLKRQDVNQVLPADELLLLMSVLSEALLTLVRCHFVLLSFLSAWHSNVDLFLLPVLPGLFRQEFQGGIG